MRISASFNYRFLFASLLLFLLLLYASDSVINQLSREERVKAEIWAAAIRSLATEGEEASLDLASQVITSNSTIPVIIADSLDTILSYNNFNVVESERGDADAFLKRELHRLKASGQVIVIPLTAGNQYLYYDESRLLKLLFWFPYVQIAIVMLFLSVGFFAFSSTKRAAERLVWVGLSKETAHQLGTPISSLMALIEILKEYPVDNHILKEMSIDVERLQLITERFSKIGSSPVLHRQEIGSSLSRAVDYIRSRSSSKVEFRLVVPTAPCFVNLSVPLFEWLVENLTKNAIDAMDGKGVLTITLTVVGNRVAVDFSDTGRGVQRKLWKKVFTPGYTTKKRGWGLGLTLVKRIVEEVFGGDVFIETSEQGVGTTVRLQLPLAK